MALLSSNLHQKGFEQLPQLSSGARRPMSCERLVWISVGLSVPRSTSNRSRPSSGTWPNCQRGERVTQLERIAKFRMIHDGHRFIQVAFSSARTGLTRFARSFNKMPSTTRFRTFCCAGVCNSLQEAHSAFQSLHRLPESQTEAVEAKNLVPQTLAAPGLWTYRQPNAGESQRRSLCFQNLILLESPAHQNSRSCQRHSEIGCKQNSGSSKGTTASAKRSAFCNKRTPHTAHHSDGFNKIAQLWHRISSPTPAVRKELSVEST